MTQLNLDALIDHDADILIQKVESKTKRIFEGFDPCQQRAIYRYQFPRMSKKLPPSMKSRIINLYDPMADRSHKFPDGLRWCANIYVGCYHNCVYCISGNKEKALVDIAYNAEARSNRELAKVS